jgi:hypothetical protein
MGLRQKCPRTVAALLCVTMAAGCALAQSKAEPNPGHGPQLKPANPQQFFIEPDQGVTLRWSWEGLTAAKEVVAQIDGYDGKPVAEVKAIQQGSAVLLPIKLPAGFYSITFPGQNQVFGLLAQSPYQAKRDPFFGLDGALSWLGPQALRPNFVSIVHRMGVSIARERLNWQDIQPTSTTWDWESQKHYESLRKLYSAVSVPILEVFHASPAWMQTDQQKFPEDLPVTETSWEQIAHRWSGYWGGVEVWNEPDIAAGNGGPQAERYVPLVETMKYALQSAHATTPVGGGVFAYLTRSYMDLAAENGLLQAVDFLSFHYYKDPFQLEGFVSEYRDYLKQFNRESLPLWITEAGKNWKGTPHTRPDKAQDEASALGFAELAVEAKACGVARIFAFVLPDYSEHGTNNFGLLDAAGTPVRSLASYATAIHLLSNAKYVGDIDLGDKAIRGRAFESSEGKTIVVIEAPAAGKYTVAIPFAVNRFEGIDGRKLEVKGLDLALADGMAYAHVDMAAIKDRLIVNTTAMNLQRSASLALPRFVASPLVIEATMDAKVYPDGVRGYEIPKDAVTLPVKVRINNLSHYSQKISLVFNEEPDDAKKREVTVPASSSRDVVQNVDVSSIHYDSGGLGKIRVEAQGQAAGTILPSVFLVSSALGFDAYLNAYPYHFALPIGDLGRWDKNSSGEMTYSKSGTGALEYSIVFKTQDHWAYPRFVLPQEVDLDRIEGVMVRGRCMQPATVRVMTWAGKSNEFNVTGYAIFPADGKWHVAYVPFSDFVPTTPGMRVGQQVKTISVGIGSSKGDTNQVEISDVILLGK